LKVYVLGTGTSTGVPLVGCDCKICKSSNPKNKRLRSSIFIENDDGQCVLVDTSPDLRQQMLRAELTRIDAVIYTHSHADHIFGIDDLRPFNFFLNKVIPLYADKFSAEEIKKHFHYCFFKDPDYEGGAPPKLSLTKLEYFTPTTIAGVEVMPISILHGKMPVLGLRIGDFAYITDASHIPAESKDKLENLDVLIINGLRNRPHKTHFTIDQAVKEIEELAPKRAYLSHLSHEVEHETENERLAGASSIPIELAYDGMILEV
jgi:phosphoribosyl 1,2-cyclic phosphate phosphodiesterase